MRMDFYSLRFDYGHFISEVGRMDAPEWLPAGGSFGVNLGKKNYVAPIFVPRESVDKRVR